MIYCLFSLITLIALGLQPITLSFSSLQFATVTVVSETAQVDLKYTNCKSPNNTLTKLGRLAGEHSGAISFSQELVETKNRAKSRVDLYLPGNQLHNSKLNLLFRVGPTPILGRVKNSNIYISAATYS